MNIQNLDLALPEAEEGGHLLPKGMAEGVGEEERFRPLGLAGDRVVEAAAVLEVHCQLPGSEEGRAEVEVDAQRWQRA